ncbi:MAG: hypothetical protein N2044_09645 [Cyclobacteriaceae bacterium]|nr:hypothetical protein [Cyclobacteriaceae bacterium]MCX7638092.1 hypothetical protein [Cyclobacteriaceae bacterium]MDW8331606.1 hypothetical protein [Cyclobacteriaceae bacterium]
MQFKIASLIARLLIILLAALSCSADLEVLSVGREKLITMFISVSQEHFRTTDCRVIQGPLELRIIPQSTEYAFFKKMTLEAKGTGLFPPVQEFYLSLSFNVQDVNQMVRSYGYIHVNPELGNSMTEGVIILKRGGIWTSHSISNCNPERIPPAGILVERQSVEEQLISGSFWFTVCIPEEIINVSGTFKDLPY